MPHSKETEKVLHAFSDFLRADYKTPDGRETYGKEGPIQILADGQVRHPGHGVIEVSNRKLLEVALHVRDELQKVIDHVGGLVAQDLAREVEEHNKRKAILDGLLWRADASKQVEVKIEYGEVRVAERPDGNGHPLDDWNDSVSGDGLR